MNTPTIVRHLDPGEAFFFMADRVSCMNFVLIAERAARLEPERIRRALACLQRENALLNVNIVWNDSDGLCFAAAPDAVIELEYRSVTDDGLETIEAELARPFAAEVAPLMRCLYLQWEQSERSALALCFHHAIGDGRSGAELLRRLLELIALPSTDLSPAAPTLLPPMYQAFPAKFNWQEHEETAEATMEALTNDYKRHGRLSRLPWMPNTAPSERRTPRIIRFELPPATTRTLLSLCRKNSTSVHGALCAAQLMAQYRLQASAESATMFLSCPVDMRPHLEPVQPATPTGLYVSLISAAFVLDAATDLWALAREIVAQTRRQLARGEGHLFFSMYGLEEQPYVQDRLPRFTKTLLSLWQNSMVSNIGAVPPLDFDPAVEAISFALCPMPYQTVFNAVSTYRDRLICNLGYDAGKIEAASAQRIADDMRERLLAATV
ncbi:MAG TPA: condensation domain-containing protein [Rhodocyclaceae bacterium]|nr:condensation domain-containing protein [Rhodocyclaceae bacterium]